MKRFFRTLVILAAALVVVGGLYAFRQSSLGQSLVSAGSGAGVERGGPPSGFSEGAPAGLEGGGGHEGHGPSLMGLVTVGKNLAIIAVSVTLIALGARMLQPGQRGRPDSAPSGQQIRADTHS
jgi:hypothetical protein